MGGRALDGSVSHIQAYNEARRLSKTLQVLHTYLQRQPYAAELVVVDDGSEDRTAALVRASAAALIDVRHRLTLLADLLLLLCSEQRSHRPRIVG
jgi:glycosyltransferase involved in cell wall biosynthesis